MQEHFVLTAIIVAFSASHCHAQANQSSLNKLAAIMNDRFQLSYAVAAFKFMDCKPIEDVPFEQDLLKNRTVAQANVTTDELHTFFKGILEADRLIQYSTVLEQNFSASSTKVEDIYSQMDTLDKSMIPLIRPALDEYKSRVNASDCLAQVSRDLGPREPFWRVIYARAVTLFIEMCLKAPVCKIP